MKNKYWIKNRLNDFYVKKSIINNYRSRSRFKIQEINNKFNIFKKNINIVDIGSSPGGWSEYASEIINNTGKIFSCDILPMKNINNVLFYKGDILDNNFLNKFIKEINGYDIKVVMSDVSPNISGFSCIDLPKIITLANLSLKIYLNLVKSNGYFILKLFYGNDINIFLKKIKLIFKNVNIFKPFSSSKNSSEFYIIANNLI
ncbi:RlmE family RNA methyltransferase [endosymbiont of Pachyrhynchus infernalis]|uniref:SAM-dependent methyltransferase n=1 Tax=endosymbiont of Pachyrhynchus infernalis TaxID=1971488 RepID=UPI000DC6D671|nr:RlmE family RNA methyltransferase [endosymbiont of Pachyrhynchus infernalis]BBA84950.1 ribosomal RNA large subunit methyltransferase E [endosymbiont of Pachyrhynchus infernalis]